MPHRPYVVKSTADTTTRGTLRSAILFANDHPGTTITFAARLAHHTITLSHELPLILGNHTVIDGSGAPHLTISGHNQFRVFFIGDDVHAVAATIENLTISHALAQGGNGGSGGVAGGGGGGLGGAIFVSDHASLAVGGLVLAKDAAIGGNGGAVTGTGHGGGGGMGGNGGDGAGNSGGGGGFGVGADGGVGSLAGSDGNPGQFTAGDAGGSGTSGGAGGLDGGGGAGASTGGGGVGGQNGVMTGGGSGGFGGGGGGGTGVTVSTGGFGGGGGSGTLGGSGGFGGGGGGGGTGGPGGFGGGAGGTLMAGGGGGAGMGGAIFVRSGGKLTATGSITVISDTVTAGQAGTAASNGSAFGAGLFLSGTGTIRFSPAAGRTDHVFNGIDDEAGVAMNGYTPPAMFTPGSYNLVKSGLGTLVLSAANAYAGATTVRAGTLIVKGSIVHSATTVDADATLAGHGTTGNVTVLGGGILSPGPVAAILHTGNLLLDRHAILPSRSPGPIRGRMASTRST